MTLADPKTPEERAIHEELVRAAIEKQARDRLKNKRKPIPGQPGGGAFAIGHDDDPFRTDY